MVNIMRWLAFYAQAALACGVNPIEAYRRPLYRGPASLVTAAGPQQFAGRTALASGTAFVTISTAVVNSDSIINATFQVSTTAGSGTNFATGVSSIVSGVSFAYGNLDGQGRAPGGTVMWEIRRTS